MTLKWTCDAEGNWRQVWVSVAAKNGRLVEIGKHREIGGPTAVWRRAA